MKIVHLKFSDAAAEQILSCGVNMTTRSRAIGQPGDYFLLRPGYAYRITKVRRAKLGDIAAKHHADEGARTPKVWKKSWCRHHPKSTRDGFEPLRDGYMVWFESIELSAYEKAQEQENSSP